MSRTWKDYSERYGETKAEHQDPPIWPQRAVCGACWRLVEDTFRQVNERESETGWLCEPACPEQREGFIAFEVIS